MFHLLYPFNNGTGVMDLGVSDITLEDAAEYWKISFPNDGNREHQIRYQAPSGQTEGVSIYVKNGDDWIQMDTEFMGIYYLFTIEGMEAEIAVCIDEKGLVDYLFGIILAVMAVMAVIALVSASVIKKKKGMPRL